MGASTTTPPAGDSVMSEVLGDDCCGLPHVIDVATLDGVDTELRLEAEADTAGRDRKDELAAGVTGVVADHVGERGRWDRSIDGAGPELELW